MSGNGVDVPQLITLLPSTFFNDIIFSFENHTNKVVLHGVDISHYKIILSAHVVGITTILDPTSSSSSHQSFDFYQITVSSLPIFDETTLESPKVPYYTPYILENNEKHTINVPKSTPHIIPSGNRDKLEPSSFNGLSISFEITFPRDSPGFTVHKFTIERSHPQISQLLQISSSLSNLAKITSSPTSSLSLTLAVISALNESNEYHYYHPSIPFNDLSVKLTCIVTDMIQYPLIQRGSDNSDHPRDGYVKDSEYICYALQVSDLTSIMQIYYFINTKDTIDRIIPQLGETIEITSQFSTFRTFPLNLPFNIIPTTRTPQSQLPQDSSNLIPITTPYIHLYRHFTECKVHYFSTVLPLLQAQTAQNNMMYDEFPSQPVITVPNSRFSALYTLQPILLDDINEITSTSGIKYTRFQEDIGLQTTNNSKKGPLKSKSQHTLLYSLYTNKIFHTITEVDIGERFDLLLTEIAAKKAGNQPISVRHIEAALGNLIDDPIDQIPRFLDVSQHDGFCISRDLPIPYYALDELKRYSSINTSIYTPYPVHREGDQNSSITLESFYHVTNDGRLVLSFCHQIPPSRPIDNTIIESKFISLCTDLKKSPISYKSAVILHISNAIQFKLYNSHSITPFTPVIKSIKSLVNMLSSQQAQKNIGNRIICLQKCLIVSMESQSEDTITLTVNTFPVDYPDRVLSGPMYNNTIEKGHGKEKEKGPPRNKKFNSLHLQYDMHLFSSAYNPHPRHMHASCTEVFRNLKVGDFCDFYVTNAFEETQGRYVFHNPYNARIYPSLPLQLTQLNPTFFTQTLAKNRHNLQEMAIANLPQRARELYSSLHPLITSAIKNEPENIKHYSDRILTAELSCQVFATPQNSAINSISEHTPFPNQSQSIPLSYIQSVPSPDYTAQLSTKTSPNTKLQSSTMLRFYKSLYSRQFNIKDISEPSGVTPQRHFSLPQPCTILSSSSEITACQGICPCCILPYTTSSSAAIHQQYHTNFNDGERFPFQCVPCMFGFDSKKMLDIHNKLYHGSQFQPVGIQSITNALQNVPQKKISRRKFRAVLEGDLPPPDDPTPAPATSTENVLNEEDYSIDEEQGLPPRDKIAYDLEDDGFYHDIDILSATSSDDEYIVGRKRRRKQRKAKTSRDPITSITTPLIGVLPPPISYKTDHHSHNIVDDMIMMDDSRPFTTPPSFTPSNPDDSYYNRILFELAQFPNTPTTICPRCLTSVHGNSTMKDNRRTLGMHYLMHLLYDDFRRVLTKFPASAGPSESSACHQCQLLFETADSFRSHYYPMARHDKMIQTREEKRNSVMFSNPGSLNFTEFTMHDLNIVNGYIEKIPSFHPFLAQVSGKIGEIQCSYVPGVSDPSIMAVHGKRIILATYDDNDDGGYTVTSRRAHREQKNQITSLPLPILSHSNSLPSPSRNKKEDNQGNNNHNNSIPLSRVAQTYQPHVAFAGHLPLPHPIPNFNQPLLPPPTLFAHNHLPPLLSGPQLDQRKVKQLEKLVEHVQQRHGELVPALTKRDQVITNLLAVTNALMTPSLPQPLASKILTIAQQAYDTIKETPQVLDQFESGDTNILNKNTSHNSTIAGSTYDDDKDNNEYGCNNATISDIIIAGKVDNEENQEKTDLQRLQQKIMHQERIITQQRAQLQQERPQHFLELQTFFQPLQMPNTKLITIKQNIQREKPVVTLSAGDNALILMTSQSPQNKNH